MSNAKCRTINPTKADELDVDFAPVDLLKAYEEKPPERFTSPATLVSIELPIGEFDEKGRRPGHVEARLSPQQGRALQRLLNGLNTKFGEGWRRRDFGYADVLRWLLDQLPP